jgi:hypothetical protein
MTTPPRHVAIGRHVWTIDHDGTRRTADNGHRGATYAERLEIVVDATLPDSLLRDTVAHELLHALWDMADLVTEDLDPAQVERIVAHLAPRLVDMLADNPELVDYLTGP